jgi:hypothetical protein
MKYIKFFLKIMGVLFLGAILIIWLGYVTIEKPYYESFVKKEQELIPLFDALNIEVESQLPPLLPGATSINRKLDGLESFSGYSAYGRWLTLEFSVPLDKEAVFAYYRSAIVAKGWLKKRQFKDDYSYAEYYYQERSCISIHFSFDTYTIQIWQDYKHQPFNPNLREPVKSQLTDWERKEAVCP